MFARSSPNCTRSPLQATEVLKMVAGLQSLVLLAAVLSEAVGTAVEEQSSTPQTPQC